MTSFGVPKIRLSKPSSKSFTIYSKFGIRHTVRDSYRGLEWYEICDRVRKRDQGCCKYCNAKESPKDGIWHDVHHLIPLSKGGLTVMSNLALACDTCHQRKHPHHKLKSKRP